MVVAGATCLMVFGGFLFLSAGFLNPAMAQDFGVGISQVMLYNSIMSLAGALSTIAIGPPLLKRIGTRMTLLSASSVLAIALLAVSFAPSLLAVYGVSVLMGLSFSLCTSLIATLLVNAWFEAKRGTVLGAVFAISGLGGVVLGIVMPQIVSGVGWRGGFRFLAAASLLLQVLPAIFLIRSTPADVGLSAVGARPVPEHQTVVEVPGVPRSRAFRSGRIAMIALALVMYHMVQAVQQQLVPLYTERGVDKLAAGSLVSVLSLCLVFTTMLIGTLSDRRGTTTALWVTCLAQAVSMTVLFFSHGYLPLVVGTFFLALGCAVAGILTPLIVMQAYGPRDFAGILGPVVASIPVGIAIGSPLWGVVKDVTGSYSPALIGGVVLSIVPLLLLTWILRTAPAFRSRVETELAQRYAIEEEPVA